jgi:transcriptional regulator with XRE-family HTH domain
MKSLGQTLKEARLLIPLTLRQVEEATGISNAYLSQLENDKIKKPSANVLYKLSCIYNIELDEILLAAGIITEKQKIKDMNDQLKTIKNLTPKEHQQLNDYLKFLRHKK